jgi:hypothetical protein
VQGTGLLRCMTHSNGGFCTGTGGGADANEVTGAGTGVIGGGVAVWLEGAGDWLVWVIICRSAGDEVGGIEPELLSMRGNGDEVAT